MVDKDLFGDLGKLTDEELDKRITRLEDRIAITNCFNRYQQFLCLQWCEGVIEAFATEMEDCSFESSKSGVCIGKESIYSFFECLPQLTRRRGCATEHHQTAPVIEIAEDGRSARYSSIAPGLKLAAPARVQVWTWFRYGGDFIKLPNGEWKIWHLRCFPIFEGELERGPLHTQFIQGIEKTCKALVGFQNPKPVKPTSYFDLFDPQKHYYPMPEPPVPYVTYDYLRNMDRTRPYMNPDIPESMKEAIDNPVYIGRDTDADAD